MAGICCGVVGDADAAAATAVEPSSRASRRRRLELRPFKFDVTINPPSLSEQGRKRRKLELFPARECENAIEKCELKEHKVVGVKEEVATTLKEVVVEEEECPKFGMTSICGGRRDMEDAVSIHPFFNNKRNPDGFHFYAVFDGHGCSHVAIRCRDRLHEIVREEVDKNKECIKWKETMERSFERMEKEVVHGHEWCLGSVISSNCRCELQTPQCDAVGSTAVVAIVTPDKIVVSNCGDSRAVLCRNGVAIPLSSDHKPDRPDELVRIEGAGGRVIYWDIPRVLGVLAMSRAIGDNYLKPYVISKPEVTVMDRTDEDECLILASDGLWDVLSNETACGVVRMCMRAQKHSSTPGGATWGESTDKACSDASILLTKLALARHSTDNKICQGIWVL
ncbi:PP2C domain-containing protein [Cephalotus follicularis]|uniref:protein-serine/threonine phosphatase n=1 Tax=Cephalotus follicularis TaxID=3775 RepID=A0A1Q3BR40_CEPFO|nr:PP2C domain-containing protein [Cephalotus follicularis]